METGTHSQYGVMEWNTRYAGRLVRQGRLLGVDGVSERGGPRDMDMKLLVESIW